MTQQFAFPLEPCPFCACPSISIFGTTTGDDFEAACDQCHASGPLAQTEILAAMGWNHRADLAAARIATLEALLQRASSDLYLFASAGVNDPSCPEWMEELRKAIDEALDD